MRTLETIRVIPEGERALLNRCRDAVRQIDPEAKVVVYGSRARRDFHEESDYDLLVLTDGSVDANREDEFRRQLFPIELETGLVLTVMVYCNADWDSPLFKAMPFHENVERDGIEL